MNRTLKVALGQLTDLLFTIGLAWTCLQWIPGFDIRGPFLFMSPFYAAGIFFFIASLSVPMDNAEGAPKEADANLVESTASEFNLGPVSVVQRRCGENLCLVMKASSGVEMTLPKDWDKLTVDARRFAIVRTLAEAKKTGIAGFIANLPSYATRYSAMVLAGLNLWLILAIHAFGAVWFARKVFWQRAKMLTETDVKALKIMKNLNAAIADPMNASVNVTADQRVAAIKKAAARMGIA